MQKYSIHNEEKVKEIMKENKFQPFRYKQIENAIYKNFITDFDKIETIPKDLRKLLKDNFFVSTLIIDTQVTSKNGQTTKTLYKTYTGEFIESVIMRHLSGRVTLCVSCQAGCPMACTFCATGKLGLLKNLEDYEIIEQIINAAKLLHEGESLSLRNMVYMGMGEPMLNYDNVKYSIEVATNQKKLDMSNRRVTVSTCGIIPGIERFTRDFPQTSLAVSLHAPNDEVRRSIMPVDHTYPIDKLMLSLDNYTKETNKRIFYEYIMIHGINDSLILADQLGKMLKGKLAHVNFIPYNEGEGTDSTGYKTTPKVIIDQFQKILLDKYGVISTVRMTMGDDIAAACGQLANKKEEA
ncbi:MAG: 23S rRNA (adenine(2503)-C(2))-methyltransferase RlmN [Candidatus Gracilibacteria bacterium]|nr:23S rRNA (adenine(2503)-C(2))-methyltransferase RlmN [Candidatus Gracilibacteria bacterium]MDQ7023693.1 23S rRNA (adenine(2503)-C(2))-methyltransferase RlmN [Candidatus Gracilibacteria bacterium]